MQLVRNKIKWLYDLLINYLLNEESLFNFIHIFQTLSINLDDNVLLMILILAILSWAF